MQHSRLKFASLWVKLVTMLCKPSLWKVIRYVDKLHTAKFWYILALFPPYGGVHICLHLDRSRASSWKTSVQFMSSLMWAIHHPPILGHQGPDAWLSSPLSLLYCIHAIQVFLPAFLLRLLWLPVNIRCHRSWCSWITLVQDTTGDFAFPSREGPAHALLSLANIPICRGQLGALLLCKALT